MAQHSLLRNNPPAASCLLTQDPMYGKGGRFSSGLFQPQGELPQMRAGAPAGKNHPIVGAEEARACIATSADTVRRAGAVRRGAGPFFPEPGGAWRQELTSLLP